MEVTDESLKTWAYGDEISNACMQPHLEAAWAPRLSQQMSVAIRDWLSPEGNVLNARERALVNLALLSVLGRERALRSRCHGLLRAGFSPIELSEVFRQTAAYAGMPAAAECSLVLAEAVRDLEAAGVELTPNPEVVIPAPRQ
jgi:alkylhydroperoxidase/carboxymuconolactone decarboxylase family protein YurZ